MSDNLEKDKYTPENGYLSIHDILASNGINQRLLRNSIEREESMERGEKEGDIVKDIKANVEKTESYKRKLISEMRGGLGKEILKNPSKIKIIKKPWYVKLSNFFKKFFTRF